MNNLLDTIVQNPFVNYMYSYPHKKAYRDFIEPIDLRALWQESDIKDLTLYLHIPFCLNKCGYCNLLSTTCFDKAKIKRYVEQMVQEMWAVREFLEFKEGKKSPFSSVILGGGTPSILCEAELDKLLMAISHILEVDFSTVFFSTETSPRTLTKSKLELLKSYHLDRISMGIQSFDMGELQQIYRNEPAVAIEKALALLFKEDIPIRNLDLIYGIPTQTVQSFKASLEKIIAYQPEELYLYPLYIREKTGLYANAQRDVKMMCTLYEFGKNFLEENHYLQTSMRNFIRKDKKVRLFPEYSCQENEMIGIGCGARSYRGKVHYSRKYAVEEENINKIIDGYLEETNFGVARYGYLLKEDEIKRRYIVKSILKVTGLDLKEYHLQFKTSPLAEYEELQFLLDNGFLEQQENRLYPSDKGIMYSDAIGNLFISHAVKQKIAEYREDTRGALL